MYQFTVDQHIDLVFKDIIVVHTHVCYTHILSDIKKCMRRDGHCLLQENSMRAKHGV
jgi:hypothetical protein